VEVVLYRCAYELVNNAVKHAHADRIDIQLMQEESQVTLTVSDNGRGLDSESQQGGIGLQNIRERISHYHGTMHIVSGKEQGTETNIILPI
jgi:signal transduction histidine kinase